jgi:hypothetical protein
MPDGFVRYRNESIGYELGVPDSWRARESADGAYVLFTNMSPGELGPRWFSVSVGSEDGQVPLECSTCTISATTMAELRAAIEASGPATPWTIETNSTTLDGLVAEVQYAGGSGGGWIPGTYCHAYAFWDNRPVVLRLECAHVRAGTPLHAELFGEILDSFRFLESPDDEAGSGDELVAYQNEAGGYELSVPSDWDDATPNGHLAGNASFYAQTAEGTRIVLQIHIGNELTPELVDAAQREWANQPAAPASGRHFITTTLGGEPAQLRYTSFGNGWIDASISGWGGRSISASLRRSWPVSGTWTSRRRLYLRGRRTTR